MRSRSLTLKAIALVLSSALLAACAVTPLPQDQTVHLKPGQGLAALMVDTLDPLTEVEVESRSGGPKLMVASVPVGISIYLFPVPAGTYCMTRFRYGSLSLSGPKGVLGCFPVHADQLGYSGTLAPRVEDGKPVTHQVQDAEGFRIVLAERYPQIAREFPAPTASTAATPSVSTPPAPGKEPVAFWSSSSDGGHTQTIYLRDDSATPVYVRNFELYDCKGLKDPCGVQPFRIELAPGETKPAMSVEPLDPGGFFYRVRFVYGIVQDTTP